jgi:hypothetical protein
MTPKDALKRLGGDERRARPSVGSDARKWLIGDAKVRIAKHAAHMATPEKSFPDLDAVSLELQRNFEAGLRLLMQQRGLLVRELAYIERRKIVARGL